MICLTKYDTVITINEKNLNDILIAKETTFINTA